MPSFIYLASFACSQNRDFDGIVSRILIADAWIDVSKGSPQNTAPARTDDRHEDAEYHAIHSSAAIKAG